MSNISKILIALGIIGSFLIGGILFLDKAQTYLTRGDESTSFSIDPSVTDPFDDETKITSKENLVVEEGRARLIVPVGLVSHSNVTDFAGTFYQMSNSGDNLHTIEYIVYSYTTYNEPQCGMTNSGSFSLSANQYLTLCSYRASTGDYADTFYCELKQGTSVILTSSGQSKARWSCYECLIEVYFNNKVSSGGTYYLRSKWSYGTSDSRCNKGNPDLLYVTLKGYYVSGNYVSQRIDARLSNPRWHEFRINSILDGAIIDVYFDSDDDSGFTPTWDAAHKLGRLTGGVQTFNIQDILPAEQDGQYAYYKIDFVSQATKNTWVDEITIWGRK